MNHCKDCQCWRGHAMDNPLADGWGRCIYAECSLSLMRPTVFCPHDEETRQADSGMLLTQGWFGCIHFNDREVK